MYASVALVPALAVYWAVVDANAAVATGKVKQVRYVEKTARQRSQFWALVGKELARFTSSPSYMLNSGLGVVFMLAAGVAALLSADVNKAAAKPIPAVSQPLK